ncbi:hypothetical protein BGZ47_000815 [Haplosporangium gracile]|nr:hypothetical protein BGZ47_000815 [Haplosporangium gracile]
MVLAVVTLESIITIFNDFYTFRDSALPPNIADPFSVEPLTSCLFALFIALLAKCYNNYIFAQPFILYAPVVKGKQAIQIYSDYNNRRYDGRTVQTIDREDALIHINAWANVNIDFSKDAGVQLNQALASLKFDPISSTFETLNGDFSLRSMLPEKTHIDYGLVCFNSTTVVPVRDAWIQIKFNSLQTFDQNVFEAPPTASTGSAQNRQLYQPDEHPLILQAKKSPFKQRRDVGAVHVWTHDMEDNAAELTNLVNNLVALSQNGVRNIVIDIQGNFSSLATFASTFVQLFFPNKDALDKTLPSNLRVTESIQQLSSALLNSSNGLYDATTFYDYTDKHVYVNNELFMNATSSIRNGRRANYIETTTLDPLYSQSSNN